MPQWYEQLFINGDITVTILGSLLSFIFGIFLTIIAQWLGSRRQKAQITYSRTIHKPLIVATEQLKGDLSIAYNGQTVEGLHSFSLKIGNTGRLNIADQAFTCIFNSNAQRINPSFPSIITIPEREVGPIELDSYLSKTNEYRYIIKTLGVGQSITLNFVMINASEKFDVFFQSNQNVEFIEGDFSNNPTVNWHLQNLIINATLSIAIFYIHEAFSKTLFLSLSHVSLVLFSMSIILWAALHLFLAYRSLSPIVSYYVDTLNKFPKYNPRITLKDLDVKGHVNIGVNDYPSRRSPDNTLEE